VAVYRRGSKGEKVKRLQNRLKQLGHYRGPIDGDYGPGTERAVRTFQRAKRLEVDGKVGPITWAALFKAKKRKALPAKPVSRLPVPVSTPAPPASIPNRTAQRNKQSLSRLHPILAIRGRCMIELCAHAGIPLLVTQGLRTWKEQDKLYAKGRTVAPIGKKHRVTNAKGGSSFHNFGLAFDTVVLNSKGKPDWDTSNPGWKRAGEIGKSVRLEWGGSWKTFKDLPHFQYIGGLTTAKCRALYPSGLQAIWDKIA